MNDIECAERALSFLAAKHGGISRRLVLQTAMLLAANASFSCLNAADGAIRRVRFTGYPFTLGVASGYPRPDAVTLWTRLTAQPLQPQSQVRSPKIGVRKRCPHRPRAGPVDSRRTIQRGGYIARHELSLPAPVQMLDDDPVLFAYADRCAARPAFQRAQSFETD
jgi:hypothetical protein